MKVSKKIGMMTATGLTLSVLAGALSTQVMAYGVSGPTSGTSGAYGTYAIIDNDSSAYTETGGSNWQESSAGPLQSSDMFNKDERWSPAGPTGYRGSYWTYNGVDNGVWNNSYYVWAYNGDPNTDANEVHYYVNGTYVGYVDQHLLYKAWQIPTTSSGSKAYFYTTGDGSHRVEVEAYDYNNPSGNTDDAIADAITISQSSTSPTN